MLRLWHWCCLWFAHSQRKHLHFPTSYLLHCNIMSVFLYIRCCSNMPASGADVWSSTITPKCLLTKQDSLNLSFQENFFFSPEPFVCPAGFGLGYAGGRCWSGWGRAVNALQAGRRRATKEATAYSKAAVQLLSHAKHSNVLCKGWADTELRVDRFICVSHLKHSQTKLGRLCPMRATISMLVCVNCCGDKSLTKMPELISPLTPAVSSLMNMMCISYLNPD